MRKLLIIIFIMSLSSCSSKENSNFRGCKYKVANSLFSSNTEISISGSYAPIDLYIIILDEIIDNKETKALKINITETNIKYLSKEDVAYIREHASKIYSSDNMLSALNKAQPIVNRISNYK
nr:MAG TPA: TRAF PROTEIN, TRAO PROTEIN, TRAN ADHESION, BACTERIAL SECRETION.5A [Caudoviricetes sp.]